MWPFRRRIIDLRAEQVLERFTYIGGDAYRISARVRRGDRLVMHDGVWRLEDVERQGETWLVDVHRVPGWPSRVAA